MAQSRVRPLVFQPAAARGLQRGIGQIIDAVRPTLGPRPRLVAIQRPFGTAAPELLDDAGTIARRIVELADRDEDMGAMFLRSLLWRLHEEVGDGTATAAVLFGVVFDRGLRYIAAGGNAMQLRRHLEGGVQTILDELSGMVSPLSGQESLTQLAASICYDPPLAALLGEIFDLIGQWGQLDIRQGQSRGLEREYVEGMYWDGGILSRYMIADEVKLETQLGPSAILISDFEIDDPHQLVPLLELAIGAEIGALLIVASRLSESALGLLINQDAAKLRAIAVKTPGLGADEQAAALQDLAILTGGRPLLTAAGDALSGLKVEDLGGARRAWANRHFFGVVGGGGDPRALRAHIAHLRGAFGRIEDSEARDKLRERIGRLLGGAATLFVGGATEAEIIARQELAQRTADALRGAIAGGVVPGGGIALLACRSALRRLLERSTDPDQRAAYDILLAALEVPARTLLSNGGYDAAEILADIGRAGPGYGFDIVSGQIVDMAAAGIFDAVTVQQAAVRGAVMSAALALTIDVLLHHRKRETAYAP